uniref:Uncharacterized protein n=1 Tax=Anopheles culicifacies TaxID=139723 RepID=A0A182LYY6_9DIPT
MMKTYLTFTTRPVVERRENGRFHVRVLYQTPRWLYNVRDPRATIDDVHLEFPQAKQRKRPVGVQAIRINGKVVLACQRLDAVEEVGKAKIGSRSAKTRGVCTGFGGATLYRTVILPKKSSAPSPNSRSSNGRSSELHVSSSSLILISCDATKLQQHIISTIHIINATTLVE